MKQRADYKPTLKSPVIDFRCARRTRALARRGYMLPRSLPPFSFVRLILPCVILIFS